MVGTPIYRRKETPLMKRIALTLVLVLALVGAALAFVGRDREKNLPPTRTVIMSMKEYTFNGENPTLAFKPGERVRFIITNDEPTPVKHNFRIVGMDVPCERELLPGETREVVVTIPASGEFAYTCCTHPGMGGKLVVAGR
jgi:plastocyanin